MDGWVDRWMCWLVGWVVDKWMGELIDGWVG